MPSIIERGREIGGTTSVGYWAELEGHRYFMAVGEWRARGLWTRPGRVPE